MACNACAQGGSPGNCWQVGVFHSYTLSTDVGTGPWTWSIVSGSLPTGLSLSSDGVISGTPDDCSCTVSPGELCNYDYVTRVIDSLGASVCGDTRCTITVFSPVVVPGTCADAAATIGVPFSCQWELPTNACPPTTVVTGFPPFTYALETCGSYEPGAIHGLPPGLSLNASTGEISGTPTGTDDDVVYEFCVSVTDGHGNTNSVCPRRGKITVSTPFRPIIDCGDCTANGSVGTPYTCTLGASSGVPPYTFAIVSGSLPVGLSLDAGSGVISGTPTTAGPYPFTAQVTDSIDGTNTADCSITIAPTATADCSLIVASSVPLAITCGTVAGGQAGVSYTATLAASGGAPPYTFAITGWGLPPGLSLDTSTGVISGTPTQAGTFPFTAHVTDAAETTASVDCSITIAPAPLEIACGSDLPSGTRGVPYTGHLSITGGTTPYTYSLVSGELPPGTSLDPVTGIISGTPTTVGTFTFGIGVADAGV